MRVHQLMILLSQHHSVCVSDVARREVNKLTSLRYDADVDVKSHGHGKRLHKLGEVLYYNW